jgi:hypothetical protein
LKYFEKRVNDNLFLDEYFMQRYPVELAMRQLHGRLQRGTKIDLPTDYAEIALLSFASMVARVYARLSKPGQKRLAGMLLSGLDGEAGLAPLVHEMGMAAHLMSRGFDVKFSDIESGGGYDFLAERDGASFEIECKTASGDLGRKVHLRRLYQLGGRVYPLMAEASRTRGGGQLARIVLPTRLSGAVDQIEGISRCLEDALSNGRSFAGPEPCSVEFNSFSLAGSPFESQAPGKITKGELMQYLEQTFGLVGNTIALFGPPDGVVVVAVSSRQPDSVVGGLVRQLKDSVKRQFSGTRPGVMCVKFLDVSQDELIELAEYDSKEQPSALKLASNYLLRREDWQWVHTLAFLTPGHPLASRTVVGQTVTREVRERGRPYVFRNPDNPMAQDGRYSIF